MLSFAAPWAAGALLLPLLLRWLLPPAPAPAALRLPIAAELLALQGEASGQQRWRVPAICAVLAWIALVAAAMQPQWLGEPVALPASGRDLMLAVDVSGSMDERDMRVAGQRLNRLQAVQLLAGDFISRRQADRVGLVLFGRQAYVYSPLSLDRATVAALLAEAEVGLAGRETAIGDAIALAVKRLRDSPASDRVLILLTDGVSNAGNVQPDKAAELAAQSGVRVHTIGFGGDGGGGLFQLRRAEIDEAQLQRIAEATGGRSFRARNTDELEQIYSLLDQIEPVEVDQRSFRPQRALFHWPLAAALALLLVAGALRGWRR